MSTIRIPTPLRQYVDQESNVDVAGDTVGQALADLTVKYPAIKSHLYEDDQLRSFVNIYVGKNDIRHLEGENTVIKPDDTLLIVPSIAGGAAK